MPISCYITLDQRRRPTVCFPGRGVIGPACSVRLIGCSTIKPRAPVFLTLEQVFWIMEYWFFDIANYISPIYPRDWTLVEESECVREIDRLTVDEIDSIIQLLCDKRGFYSPLHKRYGRKTYRLCDTEQSLTFYEELWHDGFGVLEEKKSVIPSRIACLVHFYPASAFAGKTNLLECQLLCRKPAAQDDDKINRVIEDICTLSQVLISNRNRETKSRAFSPFFGWEHILKQKKIRLTKREAKIVEILCKAPLMSACDILEAVSSDVSLRAIERDINILQEHGIIDNERRKNAGRSGYYLTDMEFWGE